MRVRRILNFAAAQVLHSLPGRIKGPMDAWIASRRLAFWHRAAGSDAKFIHWIAPGVPMYLSGDSELSRLVFCRGFESAERRLTTRLLKPGDTFVDIGANIGLYTLIAADRVGRAGRVFSFEPVPGTFARLLENMALNRLRNVSAHQVALSDSSGTSQISVGGGGFDAWSSLGHPYMGEIARTLDVELMTWDAFAVRHDLVGRVTMMKIDVEGWESRVLRGGSESLSRPDAPAMLIEFTDEAAKAAGSSCGELYSALRVLGYELFRLDDLRLKIFTPANEWPNVNILACKDRAWLERRSGTTIDG